MKKITVKTVLLITGLAAQGIAMAGGGALPAPLQPMIVKTAVNAQEKELIISGRNFGATQPSVKLAEQALEVKRFSDNEGVAHLPRDLMPATYAVTVTSNGRNRASANPFSATVKADGGS